jgi:hypothetical protein
MLAEAAQSIDHVVIIDHGRRVAAGRIDELTEPGRTLEDVFLDLTGAAR